ncbi:MAG: hypothetical protein HFJ97_03555 [Eubacterium sp.]|nr:hypothetical protein [Eubacterium sp.]
MTVCKKCLLLEAGEEKSFIGVKDYIDTIDNSLKVNDDLYVKRLSFCKECDNLISGMCLKCGCYVEIRAVFRNKSCPDFDDKKW